MVLEEQREVGGREAVARCGLAVLPMYAYVCLRRESCFPLSEKKTNANTACVGAACVFQLASALAHLPGEVCSPPPPAFLLAAEAQRGCTGEREQRLSAAFSCVWTSMSLLSRLWVGVGDTSFLLGLTMSPVSIRSHRVGQDDGFIKIRLCGTGTECLGW